MDIAETLHKDINECRNCGLCATATQKVISKGTYSTPIMFIGEAPGNIEDAEGIPFVGTAGLLLDVLVRKYFSVVNAYFTNVIKCRPFRNGKNGTPNDHEIYTCNPFLRREIEMIKPKVIVCVGGIAANTLIHPDFKITQEMGKWFQSSDIWKMAIYHPSYIVRQEPGPQQDALIETVLAHIELIHQKVDELCQSEKA